VDRGGKSMSIRLEMEDFLDAVNLINAVAPIAEEAEHHPDFHLERWNQLRITTYSHDVGKLTKRDQDLARRINEVLARRK
jgi:4a-hydroxytetrahydrobiopterin dehydratase